MGPVARPARTTGGPTPFDDILRLNPQPLPPLRRSAVAARTAIAQALTAQESAEALAADGANGRSEGSKESLARSSTSGTRPPRPYPWPGEPVLRGTDEFSAADLLVAGAQFQTAAETLEENALRQAFQDAADRLLEQGAARLDDEN